MRTWWRSRSTRGLTSARSIDLVNRLRAKYQQLDANALNREARATTTLVEVVAIVAVIASRVLGLHMFDEQIAGALALADGRIVEMQTGEGKTLAAVPAIAWMALDRKGVHVL